MSKASQPILQVVPRRTPKPAQPNGLKLEGFARQVWFCEFGDDVLLEDLQSPDFWAACSGSLRMSDVIEVSQPTRWTMIVIGDVGAGYVRPDVALTMPRAPRASGDEAQRVPKGYTIRRRHQDDPEGTPEVAVIRDATETASALVMNLHHMSHTTFETALRWLLDHPTIRGPEVVRYV
jgi:hypothetical protein